MTNEQNFFDFADLSDLPDELAEKLTRDTDGNVNAWADVVNKGAAAGFESLSINQIIAAGHRMGLEMPTVTTIRNYLNRAVELRLISKPTRMTYGPVGAESAAAPVATEDQTDAAPAADEDDPLAGL